MSPEQIFTKIILFHRQMFKKVKLDDNMRTRDIYIYGKILNTFCLVLFSNKILIILKA